jgi:hypothetical protein
MKVLALLRKPTTNEVGAGLESVIKWILVIPMLVVGLSPLIAAWFVFEAVWLIVLPLLSVRRIVRRS